MHRLINCEFCGIEVAATAGNQRTCLSDACQTKLRSKTRKERYYAARPDPICVWCGEPILEPRRRKYHGECRDDKNRERVRVYNRSHKSQDRRITKSSRNYEGAVDCMFCNSTVRRTGARQIICKNKVCINKLKQANKKRRREEKRLIAEMRARKERRRIMLHKSDAAPRSIYRVIAV